MKKLASTSRQRKKQVSTSNVVNVRQVESRNTGGGIVRRTVQSQSRSCESVVESSDSVQDEEETMATSNLSNETLRSRESTTDAGTLRRSSRDPSDSSLTLSLPKEIHTSWLEHDRSSKSEMDAAAAAALRRALPPGEVQIQRTHTQETRSTAKSIFSTNKSVVLETQQNSISALPGGHAPLPLPECRPQGYPPDVSTETSEFSDVHQYQSLDGSFKSHSDKDSRSRSSKATAPISSDASLVSLPATAAGARAGSESSVGTKPFVVSSRIDLNSAESRGALAGPPMASDMDVIRNCWFSEVQQEILQPSVSASLDTTVPLTCATDIPSAMSIDSHRFWSADVLPAISSSMSAATGLESDESGVTARDDSQHQITGEPSVDAGLLYSRDGKPLWQSSSFKSAVSSAASERDTAASLQNIPGKMADLFKVFATPALEGYETTSVSSTTFPVAQEQTGTRTKTYESKQQQVVSSRDVSTVTVKKVFQEPTLGVSTSNVFGSIEATAATPSVLDGRQPAPKFSLPENNYAASKDNLALSTMPSAFVSHEQQRTAAALTDPGMTAPKPSARKPIKQHAASYTEVGATSHGIPSAKRPKKGTESDTTLPLKLKSQTEAPPGMIVVAGLTKAALSLEQPPKSSAGVSVNTGKTTTGGQQQELQTASGSRGGTSLLTEEYGKRVKRETGSTAAASGRALPKAGPGERRKRSSAGKVPVGAVFQKGQAPRKRSSQSATMSGAATAKIAAEGRAEQSSTRRTASRTSAPNVAAGTQQPVPAMPDFKGGAMSVQPPLAPIDERLERSTTSFSISEAAAPKPSALGLPAAVYRDGRTESALGMTTGAKTENVTAPSEVAAHKEAVPSAKVQADHLAVGATVPGVDRTPTRPGTIGIELPKVGGSADVGPPSLAPIEERSASLTADANLASMVPSTLNQQTKKHRDSQSMEHGRGIVAEHRISQSVMHTFSVTPLTKKGPDIENERRASESVAYDAVITQNIEQLCPESSDIDVGLLPELCQEKLSATAPESDVASLVDDIKQDHQKKQKKELGKIMQAPEPAEKLPLLEYVPVAQLDNQHNTHHRELGATSHDPEQAEKLTAFEHKDLQSKKDAVRENAYVMKDPETPLQFEQLALSKQPKEEQEMQREELGEIVQDEKQSGKPQQSKQPGLSKKEGGGQVRKDSVKAVETPLQLEQLSLSKKPQEEHVMQREELGEIMQDEEQSEKPQQLKQPHLTKTEGGGQVRKDSVKAVETPLQLEKLSLSNKPQEEQVMQREELGEIVQDEKQSEKPQPLKQPHISKKEGGGQVRKDSVKAVETPLQLEKLSLSKQPQEEQMMQREELGEIMQDEEQSEKPQQLNQPHLTKKEDGGQVHKDSVKATETPVELEKLALSKKPHEEQVMQREELGEIVQDEKQSEKPQQLRSDRDKHQLQRSQLLTTVTTVNKSYRKSSIVTKKEGGGKYFEERKVETLHRSRSQELLDHTQTVIPQLPSGELVEALLEVPVDASAEDSRLSLEQTIDSTRRGVGDDQPERTTERLAPGHVRASLSTPVSKDGKEPAFLFEESLRRPTVSSSWAETSVQDEERRRSSSVGFPRAALTVPTAPGDELHLATAHGDKVQSEQRRRTLTSGTGHLGAVTSGARTDEAASLASGAPDFAKLTPEGQKKGPEYLSDSLTVDGSTTVTSKGPGLDSHGDMSRKSEETTGETRVAQGHSTRAVAGIFDAHDREATSPGSEDAVSEHMVTVSDSRGFQPTIGEVLAPRPRQGPSGSREGADAAAVGKKDEKLPAFYHYVLKPGKKIDIDETTSVDSDAIDEDAELTRDLYPLLAPEEQLEVAVSTMNFPYEPQDKVFEFEQSVSGKSTFREDRSSTTFLPVSSEELREERGFGQRGSETPAESLREGSEGQEDFEDGTCGVLSGSDLGKSPPSEIVFARSSPHVLGVPCTALVELPSEQQIVVAPSGEILEDNYWESEGGLSPGNSSFSPDDSEATSRSIVLRKAAARIFQAPPPLHGMFPAQDPIPLNLPVPPQPTPHQLPVERKASDAEVRKAKKLQSLSERMASTVRSTLDSAAPVLALSFALFAFVTAAAILLRRDSDDAYQI